MGEKLGDDVRLVVLAGWGFGLYLAGDVEGRESHAIDAVTGAPSTLVCGTEEPATGKEW